MSRIVCLFQFQRESSHRVYTRAARIEAASNDAAATAAAATRTDEWSIAVDDVSKM